ncbi:NAD(P)-dependent dehydrogenase, short-chain alcohol dehydrogenase family [Chitinophaga ginsengisegetis]|uniref:NAD(P)-dependent dehydrogenase, short-chain alcohol dehydrogenase family n=1 Tax=Chitinophaga ginsengisegetis TaxID=393003 RepID=A0A1T5NEH7_9BACT|nr:SDR family oxidoreductase [Chitinophaga ginsengisegetis]SKC98528.1 NAD(P)-dependent dehydrogenase, short-chain alcohol dehydrogenase family [Chitinophaga ginsengisegetis]
MTSTTNNYKGKKAVITGGTHGMGMAVVKMLIAGGAEVLLTGKNPNNLEAAKQELGNSAHIIASDTSSMTDIETLRNTVAATFGQIDFLFVNAGFSLLEPFDKVTEATYDKTFAINTKGAYFTVQQLAPLIKDYGAIVFTTSIANNAGYAGMSVYAGAKAALASFVKGFAAELLPRSIRVNAVSPGFINTPTMGVSGASKEELLAFEKIGEAVTPLKRNGSTEEVAKAALFLAFDATFTTGEELTVDGGLSKSLTPPDLSH